MNATSFRIIKSKGKEYVQEVKYRWDPISKTGRTEVLRHLGPLKPLNLDNYTTYELQSLKKIVSRRKVGDTRNSEKIRKKAKRTDAPHNSFPSLTPPNELINRVNRLVVNAEEPLSRTEVYLQYKFQYPNEINDEKTTRTHVGFALTNLERSGEIDRIGNGIRGEPYKYYKAK